MNTYTFEELLPGHEERFTATVGPEEMELFRRITGDENPLHTQQGVAYGMLTASFLSTLAGMYLPGERSLIHQVKLDFLRPFQVGGAPKEIEVVGSVESREERFRTLSLRFRITEKETGEKLVRGTMRVGVRE